MRYDKPWAFFSWVYNHHRHHQHRNHLVFLLVKLDGNCFPTYQIGRIFLSFIYQPHAFSLGIIIFCFIHCFHIKHCKSLLFKCCTMLSSSDIRVELVLIFFFLIHSNWTGLGQLAILIVPLIFLVQ